MQRAVRDELELLTDWAELQAAREMLFQAKTREFVIRGETFDGKRYEFVIPRRGVWGDIEPIPEAFRTTIEFALQQIVSELKTHGIVVTFNREA